MSIFIFFILILCSISLSFGFFSVEIVTVIGAVLTVEPPCGCRCDGIFMRIFTGGSIGFFVFEKLWSLILRSYGIVL